MQTNHPTPTTTPQGTNKKIIDHSLDSMSELETFAYNFFEERGTDLTKNQIAELLGPSMV